MLRLKRDDIYISSINWYALMQEAITCAIYYYHQFPKGHRYLYMNEHLFVQCCALVSRDSPPILHRGLVLLGDTELYHEFVYRLTYHLFAVETVWFIQTIQYPKQLFTYIHDWLEVRFIFKQPYLIERIQQRIFDELFIH